MEIAVKGQREAKVQLLPFAVVPQDGAASQEARVSDFMLVSQREGRLSSSFRGRAIEGVRLALPEHYVGAVATVDASAAGLGGCPFAGPGAAGNEWSRSVLGLLTASEDAFDLQEWRGADAPAILSVRLRALSGVRATGRRGATSRRRRLS